jgi:uncharacterized protein (DUF433 family)
MIHLKSAQTVPLTVGSDDTIRVTGSRVTLDSVIQAFQQGATAEQIQDSFPSLSLRDIYGTISYYLENLAEVEIYLAGQFQAIAETRQHLEAGQDSSSLGQALRARRLQDSKK